MKVDNQVFRDPLTAKYGVWSWRVLFNDRVCSPDFNSEGAAATYLDMLQRGQRNPEYHTST